MDLNPGQLDALVAIAEHGSFEAAARELHITPSAVSQRIRALEAMAGQVLVSRGAPCRPTPHGERLVRLGRQTRLLYDEAGAALGAVATVELPVAVNADSLTSWFRDVLATAAGWDGTAIRLRVEDQAYSQQLLRSGDVLAAVTSDREAVQGCSVEPLGALHYVPAAAAACRGCRPSSTRSRPPPTSSRPCASVSAGACSPNCRPAPVSRPASSCGCPATCSTCRCSGSAGGSTRRG